MVGFETSQKVCGPTKIAKTSILVFVKGEKEINIPGLTNLFLGVKCMIVYEPTSPAPCTYFSKVTSGVIGRLRPSPITSVTPSATPSSEISNSNVAKNNSQDVLNPNNPTADAIDEHFELKR